MADGYNGWQNYETWSVHLFVTNESWECTLDATRAALQDAYGDALKGWVEETFTVDHETDMVAGGNLFIQQMLGAAMSEVNWQEVRDSLVANYGSELADSDDEGDD